MWKEWQKNDPTILSKPHAHPHARKKTHAQFQNDQYKTVTGVALTRDTHCLYIEGEKMPNFTMWKKWQKMINSYIQTTCTSSSHTMKKPHAKFQNNRYKNVRVVALTTGTHCLYIEDEKWLHNVEKVTKNDLTIISKPHAHPHTM